MTEEVMAQQGASHSIFKRFEQKFAAQQPEAMSFGDYLQLCRQDPLTYATPAERMVVALGKPELVDTRKDSRLLALHGGQPLAKYPAFKGIEGIDETLEKLVLYFHKASQNLEEARQVLYLLGPVGSAKSTLAMLVKGLMEQQPIYRLKGSPVNESPLGLFANDPEMAATLREDYGIPEHYLLNTTMSPWAAKRLKEYKGDVTRFEVEKVYPSATRQIAIGRTEPGDENNQDISALVGSIDMRKLDRYEQNDPDAYSYSGGLCIAHQGLLEFVEMFKAPIKVLHPLLTATQEGLYKGTENLPPIPFNGVVLAHSNESEWKGFRNNPNNEAFLDRVHLVRVPYNLRTDDEVNVYKRMLSRSKLAEAPCAPDTLDLLAKFAVMSRLKEQEDGGSMLTKVRIYNGENLKDQDPKAKSYQDYRQQEGADDEGMTGVSTRWCFQRVSQVFNKYTVRGEAPEADPVLLFHVLDEQIDREQWTPEKTDAYKGFIKGELIPYYASKLGKVVQAAYLESYTEYGQNLFDRYVDWADAWVQDAEYVDPDTKDPYNKDALNTLMREIEGPAGISNPKDFRNDIVNFTLRHRANNGGQNPSWKESVKFRAAIEKKLFSNMEEILPVIAFDKKRDSKDAEKHEEFVRRMGDEGYTPKQTQRLVKWLERVQANRKAPAAA